MDSLTAYLYIAAALVAIFFVLAFVYLSIAMPFHVYQSKRKIDRISVQLDGLKRDAEEILLRLKGIAPGAGPSGGEGDKKG